MNLSNKHNAPAAVWNSFTSEGKQRFNDLMDKSLPNQKALIHPLSLEMPAEHWHRICFNMACIAGWGLVEIPPFEENNIFNAVDKLTRLGYSNQ